MRECVSELLLLQLKFVPCIPTSLSTGQPVLEVWHVFFAFVPGFVLMLLYFFDHQVNSCPALGCWHRDLTKLQCNNTALVPKYSISSDVSDLFNLQHTPCCFRFARCCRSPRSST